MPYIEKITKAGKTVLVERSYSTHIHPLGMERQEKRKKTSEAQMKINIRKAANEMTILMNENFSPGDYHLTLTYLKEKRPNDINQAKEDRSHFIHRLRRIARKEGIELKYVIVTEAGKRGALHHHLVINKMPLDWITKAWGKGRIDVRPLDDTGQYSRLAEYFAKYINNFKKLNGKGRVWTHSKNLNRPETKKRILRRSEYFSEEPRAKKGFYIDKDTIRTGISEFTGYGFLRYILVGTERRGP